MVQVIPQYDIGGALGEAFGGGLQAGTQTGLQQLLQRRQTEQQRGVLAKSLEPFGFTPEEAAGLAALPPQVQAQILKARMPRPETQAALDILGAPGPRLEEERRREVSERPEELTDQQLSALSLVNPQLAKSLMEQKKFKMREKEVALRETKKERQSITESASKAQEQLLSLDQMEDAVKSGELGPISKAAFSEMVPDVGPFISLKRALINPTAAQFKTATKAIMSGAKDIFGARVTNYDARLFQEMLPQIGRNKEANLTAIRVLKDLSAAKVEKRRILDRLIDETPERNLPKLMRKVEEEYDKYLDQKHKDMRSSLESITAKKAPEKKGQVQVVSPQGVRGNIPESQLEQALQQGYKRG